MHYSSLGTRDAVSTIFTHPKKPSSLLQGGRCAHSPGFTPEKASDRSRMFGTEVHCTPIAIATALLATIIFLLQLFDQAHSRVETLLFLQAICILWQSRRCFLAYIFQLKGFTYDSNMFDQDCQTSTGRLAFMSSDRAGAAKPCHRSHLKEWHLVVLLDEPQLMWAQLHSGYGAQAIKCLPKNAALGSWRQQAGGWLRNKI